MATNRRHPQNERKAVLFSAESGCRIAMFEYRASPRKCTKFEVCTRSGGKETASASDFSFICSHQDSQTGKCASKSKLPALPQSPSAAPPAVAINIALRIDALPLDRRNQKRFTLPPLTPAHVARTLKIPKEAAVSNSKCQCNGQGRVSLFGSRPSPSVRPAIKALGGPSFFLSRCALGTWYMRVEWARSPARSGVTGEGGREGGGSCISYDT